MGPELTTVVVSYPDGSLETFADVAGFGTNDMGMIVLSNLNSQIMAMLNPHQVRSITMPNISNKIQLANLAITG